MNRRFGLLFALVGLWLFAGFAVAAPLNVMLFIGDGMGAEQIEAGRFFDNGDTQLLTMETLPHSGLMTHNNASGGTTDSAASATAMATGQKVNNGVISVALPGDGSELTTVLEILQTQGKRAGLVTIDTDITDATPAAFGAHNVSRSNTTDIASDFFNQTRPNVLFGEPGGGINPTGAGAAGYDVVLDETDLLALNTETTNFVSGQFNFGAAGAPSLAQMTTTALNVLDNDPDGFFLLIEHEDIDSGGHANDISRVVNAVVELDEAVDAALNWVSLNSNFSETLIIITGDHETGGLTTIANNGAGNLPTVSWSTGGHTQTPLPVFAAGPTEDASRVVGLIDNTDIFFILTSTSPPEPNPDEVTVMFQQGLDGYTGTRDTFLQQDPANANTDNSAATQLNVDSDDPSGSGNDAQALIRFEDIFGNLPGQVSLDAKIVSAKLELQITNEGDSMQLHRMLAAWQDTDTWNSLGGGVQPDGIEALILPDAITGSVSSGILSIDVTNSVLAWQANPATNQGWVFLPTGDDGVDFFSAEGSIAPKLSITFVPEPSTLVFLAMGSPGLCLLADRRRRRRNSAARRHQD